MIHIPAAYQTFIGQLSGEVGISWLERLPSLLAHYAALWHVHLEDPFPLSYNYVAPGVYDDGTPVVLKAGVPSWEELQSEMLALQCYDGCGMVRMIASAPLDGIFLLERVSPGEPLQTLADDEEATRIAAQVMQRLWRTVSPEIQARFPSTQQWGQGFARLRAAFEGGCGPFEAGMVARAEGIFRELHQSPAAPVLLHGDLHHWNILSAQREPWLAIDPKGLIGEPAYEPGALLRNPIPAVASWTNLKRIQARRVAILAEVLGFDAQRIAAWGFAQAVLSAWWSYEDSGAIEQSWIAVAESLAA